MTASFPTFDGERGIIFTLPCPYTGTRPAISCWKLDDLRHTGNHIGPPLPSPKAAPPSMPAQWTSLMCPLCIIDIKSRAAEDTTRGPPRNIGWVLQREMPPVPCGDELRGRPRWRAAFATRPTASLRSQAFQRPRLMRLAERTCGRSQSIRLSLRPGNLGRLPPCTIPGCRCR